MAPRLLGASLSTYSLSGKILVPDQLGNTAIALRAASSPVSGAEVWIEELPSLSSVTTDENGQYNLTNLPYGSYRVVAKYKANGQTLKIRSKPELVKKTEETTQTPDLVLALARKVVTGVLRDSSGNELLPGARLLLWGEEFFVKADGTFTSPPLPDDVDEADIIVADSSVAVELQAKITVPFFSTENPATIDVSIVNNPQYKPIGALMLVNRNGQSISTVNSGNLIDLSLSLTNIERNFAGITFEWDAGRGSFKPEPGNQDSAVWVAPGTSGMATISVKVFAPERGYCKVSLPIVVDLPIAAPTFTVTYNGNGNTGGSVPTDDQAYQQNAAVTIKGNFGSLVKTGYTFAGWNTAADGNGTDYAANNTFSMESTNVTLYAKWARIPTYTVTYNGNGNTDGSVPTDDQVYPQDATVTVKGNSGNLVKTGYTFADWNTASDGSGTDYAADTTFSMESTGVTLYAKWSLIPTYTVTYNGNDNTGGSVPTDGQAYPQDATVNVKGNSGNLVKTGYAFASWNTAADGSGTDYAADTTFSMESTNATLYAKWALIPTHTVTYNGNGNTGGSVPIDDQAYQQNATVTVKGNSGSLVKTGYTFAGWNTAADGSGTDSAADTTFSMGSTNATLYAKWALFPVPVNLAAQPGGSSVLLSWDAVASATSYKLYWDTSANVSPMTGNKIENIQSPYCHTGLIDGTVYYYCVTAFNSGGESLSSTVVSARVDAQPPTATELSPANYSYGVATATPLTIRFNEPVFAGSGMISIFRWEDDVRVDQISATGQNVTVSNNLVSIWPNDYLADDKAHYVTIEPGSFKDACGNNFSGFTDDNTWCFKTMFEYNETLPWNLLKINAPAAWKYSTGEGVTVAVLDSGIDATHPEFVGQLAPNWVDLVNDGAYCQDGADHGTHVAGTIAAKGSNGGVIGVAPKAKLYVVKVLDLDGNGNVDDVIAGIENAVDYGAKILNISLGGIGNPACEEAVNYAWSQGALVFAATGNDGLEVLKYPAAYANAFAIGSTNDSDVKALNANYGSHMAFAAPGEVIWSTMPGNSYGIMSGTSMATPHVSALAALIWAKNPSFTNQQVLNAISFGVVDLGTPGWDKYYGYGRIDALKALQYEPAMASIRASRLAPSTLPPAKSDFSTKEFKPGELFVKIQPGETLEKTLTAANLNGLGIKTLKEFKLPGLFLLSVPTGREIEIGKKLQSVPQVVYADLNGIIRLN